MKTRYVAHRARRLLESLGYHARHALEHPDHLEVVLLEAVEEHLRRVDLREGGYVE